jgi:NADPH:quinone reductase
VQAVILPRFGPPGVLAAASLPDPSPAPGRVLIAVTAAGVTFTDTQIRAGNGPRPHRPRLPVIPGSSVGGMITAVGSGVGPALAGTRVVSATGGSGGYAEQVTVDASEPIAVPAQLTTTDAVALLADGRTALALTALAPPAPGEWVLVEAAAGGVGHLLVQLAHQAGARVIAAAGRADKRQLALSLGAELALDYTTAGWQETVREVTGGKGVSLVFDGVGGETGQQALGLLQPDGRFCISGAASGTVTTVPEPGPRTRISVIGLWSAERSAGQFRELARAALQAAAAGQLRVVIGQTFPLPQASRAHAAIEARATIGKTLLTTGQRRPGRPA